MPRLDLDLPGVAKKIGCSPWTVRFYVRAGKIPYYRPGGGRGKLAFSETEIDEWLKKKRQGECSTVAA